MYLFKNFLKNKKKKLTNRALACVQADRRVLKNQRLPFQAASAISRLFLETSHTNVAVSKDDGGVSIITANRGLSLLFAVKIDFSNQGQEIMLLGEKVQKNFSKENLGALFLEISQNFS